MLCAINGVMMSPKEAIDMIKNLKTPPNLGNALAARAEQLKAPATVDLARCIPGGAAPAKVTAHPPIAHPLLKDSGFGTHLGFVIMTLPTYTTAYYYANGPSPLGSVNHFPTIRRLKNYMNRLVKAGKLAPRVP